MELVEGSVTLTNLRQVLGERAGNILWRLSALLTRTSWHHEEYRRIYMYHVRKTAGTSMAFAFMRLADTDPYLIERRLARFTFAYSNGFRYVANNPTLIRQGNYFFAHGHAPEYAVDPPETGTFKFTILRDPIDRVLSLYRYLAQPEADLSFAMTAPDEQRRWAMEGFDSFLDQIPSGYITNQLHMFSRSGSVDEAVECLGKLNMVLRTERIDLDLARLQEALGLQLSLSRQRASLFSFTPTDAQRDRLHDLLKLEFEMLRQIDES